MRAYLYLSVVVLLFAGNIVVGKAVASLPPVTVAFMRVAIALACTAPLFGHSVSRHRHVLQAAWKPLTGMALSGVTLFNLLLYSALHFTTTTNAAVLEASIPAFVVLASVGLLGERLVAHQWLGVVVSLFGGWWIITAGAPWQLFESAWNPGDALMLGAVTAWVVYALLVKRYLTDLPAYASLTVMLAIASAVLLPCMLIEWAIRGIPAFWQPGPLAGLFYLGLCPSVIALLLYNRSIALVGASRASIFLSFLPVTTMLEAWLLLGAGVSATQLVGAGLVMGGVVLVMLEPRRRKQRA